MKTISILFVLCLSMYRISAQDNLSLEKLNSSAREKYVTPEALDRMMTRLKSFEIDPGTNRVNDSVLLDTYRLIAAAYAANNHYKQSYEVLNRYIAFKEQVLSVARIQSIKQTIADIAAKEEKDRIQENELTGKLETLKKEKTDLERKQYVFKRNMSFILIILSTVFALMLVSAGIRLWNISSKIRQNRERMKSIHRQANIGMLEDGLRKSHSGFIKSFSNNFKELNDDLLKINKDSPAYNHLQSLMAAIRKLIATTS